MRQSSSKNSSNTRRNGVVQKNDKKNKRTKKFKNTRLFKLLRIILIILIIILVINIFKKIFHKKPEKVSVVIGDKIIALKNEVEVDKNNNVFISIEDIKNLYDDNIFYSNNVLITTYNKHIAVLEKDKNTMKVNDVVQEIKGTLKEEKGTIYLPFSDMEDVYDFTEKYNKDTKILSIDSKSHEKKEAVVLKNTSLKESPKTFSKTIENVKKTQYVTVFEKSGDYSKVRTKAGNVGYIKTKKISKPEILWEDMEDETIKNVNILNDYNIVDSKYEVLSNTENNSIVIPNLFGISETEEGNIEVRRKINLDSDTFITYKDWASKSNVTICPVVTLECSMSKVCSKYETRALTINSLYNEIINQKLNMVCIDFSEIDDVEGLYRFVTEMVPRFKCAGVNVLIKYNETLNKDRLNKIVDYVID